MQTTESTLAGERTQQWKVKLISGSAAYREGGSHDVQITAQINSVGHGNQLRVIRKLAAAPELLTALRSTNCDTDHEGLFCNCPLADGTRPDKDHATACVDARAAIAKAEGTNL